MVAASSRVQPSGGGSSIPGHRNHLNRTHKWHPQSVGEPVQPGPMEPVPPALRRRVREALADLRDTGLDVRCRVGDPDPVTALRDEWDPERYDEVIVSTLPGRVSRWLQIDLPRRAGRITGAPVTHVEAANVPAEPR